MSIFAAMTYTQHLHTLNPWFDSLLHVVKKDLKQDHLSKDKVFVKNYLRNKPVAKLTQEDLSQAYKQVIRDGAENVAEFIAVRWLLKHTDLYQFFETELTKMTPDFEQLKELPGTIAEPLIERAVEQFGAEKTYIFSVLNSVVFSEELLKELRGRAEQDLSSNQTELEEKVSRENTKEHYEELIRKLSDKYEKKLLGLQKKYVNDTDAYKKQISGLMRKLQER